MGNARTLFINLFVLAIAVLLFLGLTELVFRAVGSRDVAVRTDRPDFYYLPDGAPDLRDAPHPATKSPGTFRVAVVGDSFSFGPFLQYDDTFPKRLERMLNLNAQQPKIEIVNYGTPRLSTSHEVSIVKEAVKSGADLIVLQITLNDPEMKPYEPGPGLLSGSINPFGQIEFKEGIFAHWHSAAFVLKRLHNLSSRSKYKEYFFNLYQKRAAWNLFQRSLKEIASQAQNAHVPVVAVVFPLFGTSLDSSYPFRELHERIAGALQEAKIPHLDLLENYVGIPIERIQVLPGNDFHPNEIGHRIAAEAIYGFLTKEKFVPAESAIKLHVLHRIGTDLAHANEDVPYLVSKPR